MGWVVAESIYREKPTVNCPAFRLSDGCYYAAQTGTELPDYQGVYVQGECLFRTWFEDGERAHRCLGNKEGFIVIYREIERSQYIHMRNV